MEVAIAGNRARAFVAAKRDFPLPAIARHTHFVTIALIAAATAVTRISLRLHARIAIVAAALRGLHAVRHALTILASRSRAAAGIADGATVRRTREQVHAEPIHEGETGFARALAIVAELEVLALRVARAATIRIVIGIATVVAAAIRQSAHASARSAIAEAKRVVAIVTAVAAVVDIGRQIRASVETRFLPRRTDTLTGHATAAIAILSALAAVVRIVGDVGARIATRDFSRRARALAGNASGSDRTEETAGSAVLLVGGNLDATDICTAIDGAGIADALAGHASPARAALVATDAAVVRVVR